MNTSLRALAACLLVVLVSAPSVAETVVPKPYIIAPECTKAQRAIAIAVATPSEPVVSCYFLQKWSYRGAALAVEPDGYSGREVTEAEFYQLRKRVYREQSARLRTERNIAEAMPGEPPPHAGFPLSLFVRVLTPFGVFLNESKHIGFADLVPTASYNDQTVTRERYPLVQLETFVHVNGRVIRLIQVAPITGPGTIGEGFRMADDWARRLNGGERLATED